MVSSHLVTPCPKQPSDLPLEAVDSARPFLTLSTESSSGECSLFSSSPALGADNGFGNGLAELTAFATCVIMALYPGPYARMARLTLRAHSTIAQKARAVSWSTAATTC